MVLKKSPCKIPNRLLTNLKHLFIFLSRTFIRKETIISRVSLLWKSQCPLSRTKRYFVSPHISKQHHCKIHVFHEKKNSTSIFDYSLWPSVFNALRLSAEKTLRREWHPCINFISSLRKMFPWWPISRVKNIHKCTGFKLCFYHCFIYLSLRAKLMRGYNSASIISELWNNHCWRFLSENLHQTLIYSSTEFLFLIKHYLTSVTSNK